MKKILLFLGFVSVLLLPVDDIYALDPPHSNVPGYENDCAICHDFQTDCVVCHTTTEKSPIDLSDRCFRCHSDTPTLYPATPVNTHSTLVTGTSKFEYYIECAQCHDPHTQWQSYGKFIDWAIKADLTVTDYTQDPDVVYNKYISNPISINNEFEFADGDSYYTGDICNTCHTLTAHHQNDGTAPSGQSHFDGTKCTSCHFHLGGFTPAGGECTGCHAAVQDNGDSVPVGGRRAVVGEFPADNAHAHYGTSLDSDACTVCHSTETHQDGYVELVDPDDGEIYRFVNVADLTSDPDISNFCAGCHDADGAARLTAPFDPFGNGNSPHDVATRFQGSLQWNEWYGDFCFGEEGTLRGVNSHHDISDADQAFSGAKLECLSCHGAHTAAESQPVADPFNPIAAWNGSVNDFCLQCHDGGSGPTNPGFPAGVTGSTIPMRGIDSCGYNEAPWWVEYSWTNEAHGLDSKRDWPGYSLAPAHDMDCQSCHDPHGSYTPGNPTGNPYMIRDTVDGSSYVDDGNRTTGFNGPPWVTNGVAKPVTISISGSQVGWSELCVACHADWSAAYDWHSYCNGCQTCHGHGQSWGGADFGPAPSNSVSCP